MSTLLSMKEHRARRQAARNELFAAALRAPQHRDYPDHAAWAQAFEAYQAGTMQPLREKLAAA